MTSNDLGTLADDVRALVAATADVPGERVSEARKRLAAALDSSRRVFGRVKAKAVEGAKATDQAVHEHPYQAIGIAFGVGTLIGYLLARGRSRKGDWSRHPLDSDPCRATRRDVEALGATVTGHQ